MDKDTEFNLRRKNAFLACCLRCGVEQGANNNKDQNKTKTTTVAFERKNATYTSQERALIKFIY